MWLRPDAEIIISSKYVADEDKVANPKQMSVNVTIRSASKKRLLAIHDILLYNGYGWFRHTGSGFLQEEDGKERLLYTHTESVPVNNSKTIKDLYEVLRQYKCIESIFKQDLPNNAKSLSCWFYN
jgi:hypothetical protein